MPVVEVQVRCLKFVSPFHLDYFLPTNKCIKHLDWDGNIRGFRGGCWKMNASEHCGCGRETDNFSQLLAATLRPDLLALAHPRAPPESGFRLASPNTCRFGYQQHLPRLIALHCALRHVNRRRWQGRDGRSGGQKVCLQKSYTCSSLTMVDAPLQEVGPPSQKLWG